MLFPHKALASEVPRTCIYTCLLWGTMQTILVIIQKSLSGRSVQIRRHNSHDGPLSPVPTPSLSLHTHVQCDWNATFKKKSGYHFWNAWYASGMVLNTLQLWAHWIPWHYEECAVITPLHRALIRIPAEHTAWDHASGRYKDQALNSNYNSRHSVPDLRCHSSFLFLTLNGNRFASKIKSIIQVFKDVETCNHHTPDISSNVWIQFLSIILLRCSELISQLVFMTIPGVHSLSTLVTPDIVQAGCCKDCRSAKAVVGRLRLASHMD